MPRSTPFRLSRSGLMLALVSAAFAGEAGAVAGRAEFVIGGVTIANRDGVERPLQRGTALDNGDVVRTNANGRAQIRFTDGAYVSLQPNTEFGIRDYNFQNKTDGSERGFFGLLKGAMRTVTGLIGQVNRDRYQITTPTATVGIRGTGGVIQVLDDGSTLIIGSSGIWSLTNPSGSIDVPAGTSGLSPSDPNQPPRETNQPPTSGPAPIPEPEPVFVQGEERDEAGNPVILPAAVLVSGDGYNAAIAFGAFGSPFIDGGEGSSPATAVFNSSGQLTELQMNGATHRLEAGGSHADFGTDGVLAWGRWTGETTLWACEGPCAVTLGANEGFHYVIGMPTTDMPVNAAATYTLIGATRPTWVNGQSAPGTFSGSLAAQFTNGTTFVDGNFNVAIDGKNYGWSGSASTSSNQFAMSTGQVGGCSSTCNANVNGFFAGAGASRAGISYRLFDDITGEIVGAAAFKRGELGPLPR